LAVEESIHGAAHSFEGQFATHILLKNILSFLGWLKPLHAHTGQRVFNFSFALCPPLVKGCYSHPDAS
jgi:hypothetical protein